MVRFKNRYILLEFNEGLFQTDTELYKYIIGEAR